MSSHSSELFKLFTALKEDRKVSIRNTHPGPRIRYVLHVNGDEGRPYTDREVKDLLKYYEPFKQNLRKNKLWPVRRLR